VTHNDKITGRKKENQFIPNKIEVKLKLPSEIMTELLAKISSEASVEQNKPVSPQLDFGVKSAEWSQLLNEVRTFFEQNPD